MIRIVIADDHKLVLNGIAEILSNQNDINLVAAVSDGKQLLDILKEQEIDIALSDIDMPLMTGLDVVKAIKNENIKTKIILLSVHDEKAIIQKAFSIGADGYLLKKSEPELIIDAIKSVHKGKKIFDVKVMEIVLKPEFTDILKTDQEKLAKLTDRELEIVKLIVEGFSNQEIGEKLFVSKRTIDTHRNNLMIKMGFNNTVQLVKFAIKNGLSE